MVSSAIYSSADASVGGVSAVVFPVVGAFVRGSLVTGVSVLVSLLLSASVMIALAIASLEAGALVDA